MPNKRTTRALGATEGAKMAYIPRMAGTPTVVALIACVLDARDGASMEVVREASSRVGAVLAENPAEYVTTSAFVGATLAQLAAEALEITPEEVLAAVLNAGSEITND